MFHLHLFLRVDPGPGPSRPVDVGGADVASRAPDPREDIANCVVPANDESTHAARRGMEAISIQRFLTLPSRRSLRFLLERVSGALVAAPVGRTAHPQGHPEPEPGAYRELRVLEADP